LGGKFVCNDADYTTGNLGKSWNELDLVPHRLTTQGGTQADATTDYNVIVAADNVTNGTTGYDVIDGFAINTAKSDSSCSITSIGAQGTTTGVTGGADTVMYRTLGIHQSKGTTCVVDYYQRLALGAAGYPGSSLQSYMFEREDFSTGKKTLSIPVNEIAPQELNKDMSATRNSDHAWNVTKGATPAQLAFNNTCDNSESLSNNGVKITVSWTKQAANPTGPATIITHVYATNPAARVITLNNVTDNIYAGNDQTTLLDTASAGAVDLAANTANILVLTHTFVWNSPGTSANDVATATYTDKVTGVPIPGTTTANASANVTTATELNASAIINDVESITGSGLSYSTDSFSGASGSFDNSYVAGTKTTGNVSWTSDSQSGSGSVEFDKTVYAAKGTIEPNGNLHDEATLTGSDGASASATADIPISVDTIASLTIDKTIPNILQGSETATFLFHVKSTDDVKAADVASTSITFTAGQTHKTADVSNLAPGVYYVFEDAATGWNPNPNSAQVDVSGDACGGTASFTNTAELASARVKKVTYPAGFEGNWEFKLYKGASLLETVMTSDASYTNFSSTLGEGSYSILETSQDGWSSDGGSAGCSFTVNLPSDGGKTFDCTFTNTYQPSVDLTKTGDTLSKIGDKVHYTFEATNTSSPGGAAGVPALVCTITDPTIGYNSGAQTIAAGGSFNSSPVEFTIPSGAADPFPNTASVSCTYPSSATAVASDTANHSVNLFQPSLKVTKAGPTYSKVGDTVTYSITIENTSSSDSPDLVFDSFSDSKAGSETPPPSCNTLAHGASCSFTYTYTVQAGDSDPLLNAATAHYHPSGFPNDIAATGNWSVDLLHPSFTLSKSCDSQPVPQGGTASFTVTLNNTGDADLVIDPDEGASNTYAVAAGKSTTFGVTVPVSSGASSVSNTVHATATLASKYSLSNVIQTSPASAICSVAGLAAVHKTVSGQKPATGQIFHFQLRSGASTLSDGAILEEHDTDANGDISFTTNLTPGAHYQLCEWVYPGWNTNLGPNLFVPNSMTTPTLPNPNVNNLTVCTDFVAQAGQTTTFNVDNTPPPGGRALTIGFWKNWASCSGSNGKQKPVLDQTLAAATGLTTNPPGGLVYSAQTAGGGWPNFGAAYYGVLRGSTSIPNSAPDCSKAVNLLNKSTATGGKKMSSDPIFNMTAQLVGAQLNYFAGAGKNGTATLNIQNAVLLNGKYQFNGNTYGPKLTPADTTKANCLATQLDNYNNGRPVSTC
jgi:hypothetical protein